MTELNILLIENLARAVESVKEVIDEFNGKVPAHDRINLLVSRHMASAKEHLDGGHDLDGAIVDLMLPRCQADLESLEPLEEEREQLMKQLLKDTHEEQVLNESESVMRLRKRIDLLDEDIDSYLDLDGGFHVLEHYVSLQRTPDRLPFPAVIVTARGNRDIRGDTTSLAEPGQLIWLEKPVDVVVILKKMLGLLGRSLPKDFDEI